MASAFECGSPVHHRRIEAGLHFRLVLLPGYSRRKQLSKIVYLGQAGFNNLLIIEVGYTNVTNEKLYFTVAVGGSLIPCYDSATNLQKNRWYHLVAVVGPTDNTGYLEVWK